MATSGSTNYSTSRDSLIARALRITGVLSQGETATATQVTEASEALNGLTKALIADGMPLWGIKESSFSMTASTRNYRIGLSQTVNIPKPLKILRGFIRQTANTTDQPVTLITRDEYDRLTSKTATGVPVQMFYDPQLSYGDLYLYPAPNATIASNYTMHIVYQRPFEDFDAAGDEPDFPQEWYDALAYLLADRLAPEYGVSMEHRMDIQKRAMQYKAEALSFGTERGSFYFQVDRRYN